MAVVHNSYPLLREAKVVSLNDPEKLGRIQLKVYPELSEISDSDCPWCFPQMGGSHGKSFGVPLVDKIVSCIVWTRFWNEITFLPFVVTKPTEHLFDKWLNDQRSKITDMGSNPEEDLLVVEQYADDFNVFNDAKNSQHGFLHPSETYGLVANDGSMFIQSVKKYTFHNKNSDLTIEVDSETGNIKIETKGDCKILAQNGISLDAKSKFVSIKNQFADLFTDVLDKLVATLCTAPTTMGSPTTQNFNPTIIADLAQISVKLKSLMQAG